MNEFLISFRQLRQGHDGFLPRHRHEFGHHRRGINGEELKHEEF